MDAIKNNAIGQVLTAPSPPTSGTSLILRAGQGAYFPTPPFNAVCYPILNPATPIDAEIFRVTNISTDTLTMIRAQEGTTARSIIIGDRVVQALTKKWFTDLLAITAAMANGGSFSGSASITNGTSSGSVSFAALPFTPSLVFLTVSTPAAGSFIAAAYDATTLTTTGFNYVLSIAAPATGYKLNYLVI